MIFNDKNRANTLEPVWNYDSVKSQIFVRYPFSYFWLETGSHKLIFVLLRASKQNYIEIRGPHDKKKFPYSIKFSTFFQKYESTKISTGRKCVTLQYASLKEKYIFVTLQD